MKKVFYICVVMLGAQGMFYDVSAQTASKREEMSCKTYEGIVAIVNDDIITSCDLQKRVKMALLAMKGQFSEDMKKKIAEEVLEEMISERLKWGTAQKFAPHGGWISDADVDDAFSNMAARNNMNEKTFSSMLENNGVSKDVLLRQIKVNLSWMEYIRARYGKSINISSFEAENLVRDMKEKRNCEAYYVGRMFFPVRDTKGESDVAAKVSNVCQMLRGGADFSHVAQQFARSTDATAKDGDLGWIFEGQLSPEENQLLKNMSIGEFRSVRNSRGYAILLLRNKRKGGQQSFTNLRFSQVIAPFGDKQPTEEIVSYLSEELKGIRETSKDSREFIQRAKESGFCVVSDPINIVLEEIQPEMRQMIESIPAGGISKPIVTPGGVVMICMLERKVNIIKEPTLEDLKSQRMGERLSVFADRELQDAKKKADIKFFGKYVRQ